MKKYNRSLLSIAVMTSLLSLTACGGNGDTRSSANPDKPPVKPIDNDKGKKGEGNKGSTKKIVAVDDTASVQMNKVLNGNVSTNDTNEDDGKYTKASNPTHGTVVVKNDGTYTYTPNNDFKGEDSFTYTLAKGDNKSTATVKITVNDEPIPEPIWEYPNDPYYGENLGKFPPAIRKWAREKFNASNMELGYQKDSKLKLTWVDDGNAVVSEASYIDSGSGKKKVWDTSSYKYEGDKDLAKKYGQYKKYRTLKYLYETGLQAKARLKVDPAYAEVVKYAKKLSAELEYNWSNFKGYHGPTPQQTPGKPLGLCVEYSEKTGKEGLNLPYVTSVEEWGVPTHTWNVFNLKDGRRLYVDVTWFDNEDINKETGEIFQTDDYDWENITFDKHAFDYSNVTYGSTEFTHAKGKLLRTFK